MSLMCILSCHDCRSRDLIGYLSFAQQSGCGREMSTLPSVQQYTQLTGLIGLIIDIRLRYANQGLYYGPLEACGEVKCVPGLCGGQRQECTCFSLYSYWSKVLCQMYGLRSISLESASVGWIVVIC